MTCTDCRHAYLEDNQWFSSPSLRRFNIDVACALIRPEDHIGSHVCGADDPATCGSFEEGPHPVRVWPARTKAMIRDNKWYTNLIPETTKTQTTPQLVPSVREDAEDVGRMTSFRRASWTGACCFKCVGWRTCPIILERRGDAGHVCDDFRLDRTRWATVSVQVYEARIRAKRGHPLTLEDFS